MSHNFMAFPVYFNCEKQITPAFFIKFSFIYGENTSPFSSIRYPLSFAIL